MAGYSLNETRSAWEVVEGEAVAVSTDTSAYYSLDHCGAAVLASLLGSQWAVNDVVGALSTRYEKPVAEVAADIEELLRQLVSERLLVTDGVNSVGPNASRLLAAPLPLPESYERPSLTRHGDLTTLILSAE